MSEQNPEATFTEKVEAEVTPRTKPENTPNLIPLKAVPRRRRAELMRKFEVVSTRLPGLKAMESDQVSVAKAAVLFDLMADVEEMLVEAAHDRDAFTAWAAEGDDKALMELFGWYVTTFQVGE